MRLFVVLVASVVVGAVLFSAVFSGTEDERSDGLLESETTLNTQSSADSLPLDAQSEGPGAETGSVRPISSGSPTAIRREDETPASLIIGEPLDPDDVLSWPENEEVLRIGEDLDPDDPSTWSAGTSETLEIGEPLNPDDPSTWLPTPDDEKLIIGEPMDPDSSLYGSAESEMVLTIGEPRDPGTLNSAN